MEPCAGVLQVLKAVTTQIQTVRDGTVPNLLSFPSRLPVLFGLGRTDCLAVDFDSKWMETEVVGIPVISNQFLLSPTQLQMELWNVYSNPHLDTHCFYSGGEQPVKVCILILGGLNLRQWVAQSFQICSYWIPNFSRWICSSSILIPVWTPSAFLLGGEQIGKPWVLILGGWNLR